MSCININSRLYSILKEERNLSLDQIEDFSIKINSDQFTEWYGKGKRDSYGQPELYDKLYLINDKSEKISLMKILNNLNWTAREKTYSDISALEKLHKTLEDLNVGLRKRISAYRNSDYSENLAIILEEINHLNDTNAVQALAKHTEYILKTIQQFKDRLYQYDADDVSKLNEKELQEREDKHLNFLLQAEQFLDTFEQITNLEEFKNRVPGVNLIIKHLKDAEHEVTGLKSKVFAALTDKIKERLEKLSTNPEILSGSLDFLASVEDASFMQRWFDSMADTHHPVIAAMVKKFKRTMYHAKEETSERLDTWKAFTEENDLKNEKDFDKFIDFEKAKFLEEFNIDEFNDAKFHYLNRLRLLEQQGKKDTSEYETLEDKYKDWQRQNTYLIRGQKGLIRKPNNKWKNKKYEALSDKDKQTLFKLRAFIEDIASSPFLSKGYIPSIAQDFKNQGDKSDERIISEGGDIIKFLKIKYLRKLNQTGLQKFDEIQTVEQLEEYEKQVKENRLSHGKAVNKNLAETMKLFIKEATEYKYKKSIENEVKLVNSQLKRLMITSTDAKGKPIIDKIASTIKGTKIKHEIPAIESKIFQQWKDFVEGVFYNEFTLDEGTLTEVVDTLQNVSSFTAIGFNVISAVNNKIVGNIQTKIEAVGGQYFNTKEYANARWIYAQSILSYISNRNKETSDNLIDALIKKFDILQDKSELTGRADGFAQSVLHKLKMLKSGGYFMQHIGEHQVQNTSLLAMLQSHRIIDGKIVSFFEYLEKSSISADVKKMQEEGKTKEEIENFIKENKVNKKDLHKEFSENPSLLDSFELNTGKAKLKEGVKLDKDELADFTEKVKAVNQKLHGAYNTEDAAMLQRYALGRLGMQFRKWLPNAWNRRFGNKFGKSYWNERRKEYNEGMYITFGKYIFSPFVKNFSEYKTWKQRLSLKAAKIIIKGYKDLIFHAKINWNTLTELEKVNIRRTSAEMCLLTGVVALGFLLKGMGGDDDDNKALVYALYESDRLYGELSFFTPFGVVYQGKQLTQNPFIVFRTLENIGKLASNTMLYPFRDEEEREFKTGIYHGRDKASVYLIKSAPIISQIQNMYYMSEQNQRFGLFK